MAGTTTGSTDGSTSSTSEDPTTGSPTSETASSTGVPTTGSETTGTTGGPSTTSQTGSTGEPGTTSGTGTGTGTGTDSGTDTEATSGTGSTGGNNALPCPAYDLGSTVPQTFADTTAEQDNELGGTCGGGGAPDMAFTFTAPETGPYTFDTFGSEYDTVLYVLDGECGGEELGCDDDSLGSGDSLVSVDLTMGQSVTVVVDGFQLLGDAFELHVSSGQISCPRDDLGSTVPQTYTDNIALAANEFTASCGGGTSPDFAYTFTAPEDGQYLFDTFGSDFNTVLYLLDGTCGGNELACNNDVPDEFGPSAVSTALTAGQTITVVVEGYFGAVGTFDLNISQLGGTCPDSDLGMLATPFVQNGNTDAAQNTLTGSCGGFTSADDSYLYTAPADGFYIFDTEGSSFDTVLYIRDGGCGGPELACNNDAGAETWSSVSAALSAGQTVAIVVDGAGATGDYALNVDTVACPGPELMPPLPITEMGSTVGYPDLLFGGCGFDGGAPERTYLFTAPNTASYQFDTNGSDFDTILYLLDGPTCGDAVLSCNDDGGEGLQSLVTANLTAGQQVVVVVDGYGSNSGNYDLNITEL